MADDGSDVEVVAITSAPPAPERPGGPRAWMVLAGTALAALAVLSGVFAFQAWHHDVPAADPQGEPGPDTAPPERAELDQGDLLFRRVTGAGIEIRARLTQNQMMGRVIGEAVPGTMLDDSDVAVTAVAPPAGPEGLARTVHVGSSPATTIAAPPVGTMAVLPRQIDGNGAIVDPEDLAVECQMVGDLTAWAISDQNIAQGGTPWMARSPDELYPSLMWDGMAGMGDPDSESIVGVVLQVPDDVTNVRLRTVTASDEMDPVDGAAVLAVLVTGGDVQDLMNGGMGAPAARNAVAITAIRADGSQMSANLLDAMNEPHPAWGPQCQSGMVIEESAPPTTIGMPEAGSEQPVDPANARAEVEHNFSLLYGRRDPAIDRARYIDDDFGFADASAEVDANFPGVAESARVTIDELVFADATNAVFRYTLDTASAEFGDQIGRARLVDGVWKITRGTLCQDMAHGGGSCPP